MAVKTVTVPKMLNRPGWRWTSNGLEVMMGKKKVFFPIRQVIVIFDRCLKAHGVAQAASVGACYNSVGFLKKIGRGIKKATSGIRKTVSKVTSHPFVKGVTSAVKKVGTVAKNVVTHPAFRAGFAGLATAFPVLAPAAVGLEVASRTIDAVEKGKKAAKEIKKGVRTAKNLVAVKKGRNAQKGIQRVAARAAAGDVAAQRATGAIVATKSAARTARKKAIKGMRRRGAGPRVPRPMPGRGGAGMPPRVPRPGLGPRPKARARNIPDQFGGGGRGPNKQKLRRMVRRFMKQRVGGPEIHGSGTSMRRRV